MNETEKLYKQLNDVYIYYDSELKKLDDEIDSIGRKSSSIVVKTIKGKKYYYEQWRDGSSIKNKSLGTVFPGSIASVENIIIRRNELLKKYAELLNLQKIVYEQMSHLKKDISYDNLENYSFEVFWKDELSARVSARGKRVHVSRYIIHPVRQLFYNDSITRNQLNTILKLRCFDEGRPDALDKLRALGLTEYKPLDIVRKTHGVSYNDFLWFRFPGENISSKDVLVR